MADRIDDLADIGKQPTLLDRFTGLFPSRLPTASDVGRAARESTLFPFQQAGQVMDAYNEDIVAPQLNAVSQFGGEFVGGLTGAPPTRTQGQAPQGQNPNAPPPPSPPVVPSANEGISKADADAAAKAVGGSSAVSGGLMDAPIGEGMAGAPAAPAEGGLASVGETLGDATIGTSTLSSGGITERAGAGAAGNRTSGTRGMKAQANEVGSLAEAEDAYLRILERPMPEGYSDDDYVDRQRMMGLIAGMMSATGTRAQRWGQALSAGLNAEENARQSVRREALIANQRIDAEYDRAVGAARSKVEIAVARDARERARNAAAAAAASRAAAVKDALFRNYKGVQLLQRMAADARANGNSTYADILEGGAVDVAAGARNAVDVIGEATSIDKDASTAEKNRAEGLIGGED